MPSITVKIDSRSTLPNDCLSEAATLLYNWTSSRIPLPELIASSFWNSETISFIVGISKGLDAPAPKKNRGSTKTDSSLTMLDVRPLHETLPCNDLPAIIFVERLKETVKVAQDVGSADVNTSLHEWGKPESWVDGMDTGPCTGCRIRQLEERKESLPAPDYA